ncbi:DUF4142 domain-containing protein [Ramlibacter humi]|nr:DUF4142 domain-containing protein [Ramlibacter humi]
MSRLSRRSFQSRILAAFAVAGSLPLLPGCATNRAPDAEAGAGPMPALAADDRQLATQAAGGGLYEVEAGRLAEARASRPEVRSFGQMLVEQHLAANAELASLLQARGMAPPTTVPPRFVARLAAMGRLSGPDFDLDFVRTAGLEDHEAQIALFESGAREAHDPALRAWFGNTLPVLRNHLAAAQSLAGAMVG